MLRCCNFFFPPVCLFEPCSLRKVWVIKGCEGNPVAGEEQKLGNGHFWQDPSFWLCLLGTSSLLPCCIPSSTLQDFLGGSSGISSSNRLKSNVSWEVSSDGSTKIGLTINCRVRESGNTKKGNKIQSDLDQRGAGGASCWEMDPSEVSGLGKSSMGTSKGMAGTRWEGMGGSCTRSTMKTQSRNWNWS